MNGVRVFAVEVSITIEFRPTRAIDEPKKALSVQALFWRNVRRFTFPAPSQKLITGVARFGVLNNNPPDPVCEPFPNEQTQSISVCVEVPGAVPLEKLDSKNR